MATFVTCVTGLPGQKPRNMRLLRYSQGLMNSPYFIKCAVEERERERHTHTHIYDINVAMNVCLSNTTLIRSNNNSASNVFKDCRLECLQ